MSVSVDNFLKSVYLLNQEGSGEATGSVLASRLQISSAAVTDMARKLSVKGMVHYTPYKEVVLTSAGSAAALKVIRKHRLWELFLQKVLDLDLKNVHEEAERLEHHASDNLMNHIDAFLGHPSFDPHGEPIPNNEGVLPESEGLLNLIQATNEKLYRVARIIIREAEIFDLFESYGIEPGRLIQIVKVYDFDKSLQVEIEGKNVILSEELSQRVYVSEVDGQSINN
jgi:DtxR family Mn-dependent transcriptional regulator